MSGVRRSWEALATKRRWDSKAASRRPMEPVDGVAEVLELVVGAGERQSLL
jgi:hypothetical protein